MNARPGCASATVGTSSMWAKAVAWANDKPLVKIACEIPPLQM